MNRVLKSVCLLLLVGFAGCVTRQSMVVDEPVGPDLARPRVNLSQGQGELVVYSALDVVSPVGADFPTHTGYEIYNLNENLVRRVDNRSGPFYQTPATVRLPVGEYKVKARATNHGMVTVPVIVKENETTVLDLDTTHFRQHKPTGAGQWVRLPTGEVVGMRAP